MGGPGCRGSGATFQCQRCAVAGVQGCCRAGSKSGRSLRVSRVGKVEASPGSPGGPPTRARRLVRVWGQESCASGSPSRFCASDWLRPWWASDPPLWISPVTQKGLAEIPQLERGVRETIRSNPPDSSVRPLVEGRCGACHSGPGVWWEQFLRLRWTSLA